MNKKLCVDASVVIKWLVNEENSRIALNLLEVIQNNKITCYAPSLIDYEVGTTLRLKVHRGLLKPRDMYAALEFYKNLPLLMLHVTDLCFKSIPVAESLEQPTIYDIGYLLVAQQQNADLVTADNKFYLSARSIYPFVHNLSQYP